MVVMVGGILETQQHSRSGSSQSQLASEHLLSAIRSSETTLSMSFAERLSTFGEEALALQVLVTFLQSLHYTKLQLRRGFTFISQLNISAFIAWMHSKFI
ncbi:hypothetical protein Pcinc_037537 [Petrolisthes cinctipes]|uniref:Uncharacterized protein n=1 Tax=Petrolisthes cinctipes TaxID=88211 RepID=A0AAE1BVK0_PETCI|nr:hypothetical protein Pcinc_037537 [Petrolisthes cinctipes]